MMMMDNTEFYLRGKEDGRVAERKEIIEWAKETCPHSLGDTHCYKRVCDECWRDKLKEWGIE